MLQHKLPHLQPGRQSRAIHPSEAVVQSHIKGALRSRGYIVLETSEHRKREHCPKCGNSFASHNGRGCDKGIPDLLVTSGPRCRHQWPVGVWVGIEVKGHKTPLSPEQEYLLKLGAIYVVRSVDEAVDAIEGTDGIFEPKQENS